MVKRIILFKIKDDPNKQTNINLLRDGLLSLKNSVSEIISLEVGLNFGLAEFDIVFIGTFNDPFSLKQFQSHPEFQKIFQMAGSVCINTISCDFMTESNNANSNVASMPSSTPNIGFSNSNPSNPSFNNNNFNNNGKRETLATSASTNDAAFSLPFNSNQNPSTPPLGGGSGMGSAYGYGASSGQKNAVNFTVSENVNQIKFENTSSLDNNPPLLGGGTPGMNANPIGNNPMGNNPMGSNPMGGVPMGGNPMGNNPLGTPNNPMGGANNPMGSASSNMGGQESWRCTKCGKTNASFINMCSCGKRKPMTGNTGLVPKMPASPINSTFANKMGPGPGTNPANNWICPSCGKSNNDFMKVCVCGHRKVEKGAANNLPAYNAVNGINKSMMPLPKNPGGNNVKSPNNNEFFNGFGNNNGQMNRPMGAPNGLGSSPMGGPNNPMGGNQPSRPMGGPNGLSSSPMGGPNNPMGGNQPGRPMGGPNGLGSSPMGGPNKPMGGNQPGRSMMSGRNPGPMGSNQPVARGGSGPMGGPIPGRPVGGPMGGNQPGRPMGGPNSSPFNNRPSNAPPMGGGNANSTPPDSWKCPRCGKVLGNFVGQCVCGQRKPSRTNMQF